MVFEDAAAAALEALWRDDRAETMTDWAFRVPVVDGAAGEATGTTTLTPVVVRGADGETERTEFALLSRDDSSDSALDAADVTMTPGAVSVMVIAIV
jgi:hypothetical protein